MRRRTLAVCAMVLGIVLTEARSAKAYTVPVWDYVRTILDVIQGLAAQYARAEQVLREIEATRAAYRNLKNFGGEGEWFGLVGMYGALSQTMNQSPEFIGYKSAGLDELLKETYPGVGSATDASEEARQRRLRRTLETIKALMSVLDHDSRPNVRSELRLIAAHDRQGIADGELEALETGHVMQSLKLNTEGRRLQARLARANIRALVAAYRVQEEVAAEEAFAEWSSSEASLTGIPATGYGGVPQAWERQGG